MNLLLDTHAFLWFIGGNPKLPVSVRTLIEDSENQSLVSIASLWEMAIKVGLSKLSLGQPFDSLIPRQLSQNGFQVLPISLSHLSDVISLPIHHRDPFDRLLIAQATVEKMPIVSNDAAFDAYGVRRLW